MTEKEKERNVVLAQGAAPFAGKTISVCAHGATLGMPSAGDVFLFVSDLVYFFTNSFFVIPNGPGKLRQNLFFPPPPDGRPQQALPIQRWIPFAEAILMFPPQEYCLGCKDGLCALAPRGAGKKGYVIQGPSQPILRCTC